MQDEGAVMKIILSLRFECGGSKAMGMLLLIYCLLLLLLCLLCML